MTLHHTWFIRGSCIGYIQFTRINKMITCCGVMYDRMDSNSIPCSEIINVHTEVTWVDWNVISTGKTHYGFLLEITGKSTQSLT